MDSRCEAFVNKKGRKRRMCRNQGNSVLANGYCRTHQVVAVLKIMERLQWAEIELAKLQKQGTVQDMDKLELAQRQVEMLKHELKGRKRLCEQDSACSHHLKDVMVSLVEVADSADAYRMPSRSRRKRQSAYLTPDPNASNPADPSAKLRAIERDLNRYGKGTYPEDALAMELSKEHELSRRRLLDREVEVAQLEHSRRQVWSDSLQQEKKFVEGIEALRVQLEDNRLKREQAETVVASLEKRLDRCRGESQQVSGLYTEAMQKLKTEAAEYKELYNSMKGRELRLSKSIDQFQQNEKALQKAVVELKMTYEAKIAKIRNEFAEQAAANEGTTLSEREQVLQGEIDKLKADLEEALQSLKAAKQAGEIALEQAQANDKPYAQIAQDLMEVNARLSNKNKEVDQLQTLLDKKTQEFARAELQTARRIDQATERDRRQIEKLNNEVVAGQSRLSRAQQEIANLEQAKYSLTRKHEALQRNMERKLQAAQAQLRQIQQAREVERRNLTAQFSTFRNQKESERLQQDLQFNQLKENLNRQYAAKVREMEAKFEANASNLEKERRNMEIAQRQIRENQKIYQQQRVELERYRAAFTDKMSQFNKEQQTLKNQLSQAQSQALQFSEIEKDYQKRVDLLRQQVAVAKQRCESNLGAINGRLREAVEARNHAAASLAKCNAGRDALVAKVDQLTDENSQLKDSFMQMKTRLESQKAEYEAVINQLRADASRLTSDLQECGQKMEDATLVHDHVKRLKAEAQALRQNLEQNIRAAKGNEQALQRLLRDRELEKNQVIRLQNALRDCTSSRNQTERTLQATNDQIFDLKNTQGNLSQELQNLSRNYQRTLKDREAVMTREKLKHEVKENMLERELAQFKQANRQKESQISQLSRQRDAISNTLADTELQQARQIQALVEAQRFRDPDEVPRGQSSLLSR